MKVLKWSGISAIIIMSGLSFFEIVFNLFGHHEPKSVVYVLDLSFQDTSGNDLVKGIELTDRYCPVDIPEEQAQSGYVKSDLYALDIIVPEPCQSAIASSRFDAPGVVMYKYGGLYFSSIGYTYKEDECPAIEVITYKLKCPYVFGDDAVHEFVTYWEKTKEYDALTTCYKCNRIEFEGKVITDITNGNGQHTSMATIILEDRENQ